MLGCPDLVVGQEHGGREGGYRETLLRVPKVASETLERVCVVLVRRGDGGTLQPRDLQGGEGEHGVQEALVAEGAEGQDVGPEALLDGWGGAFEDEGGVASIISSMLEQASYSVCNMGNTEDGVGMK